MKEKQYTKPFYMSFNDSTAFNGVAKLKFLPYFDKIPSTGEFVNTKEKAKKYWKEVCCCETKKNE